MLPGLWSNDARTLFIGTGSPTDAGAIRIYNPSARPLWVDGVSIDIGSAHYDLWGPYPIVVPTKSNLILTQTSAFDFDTSEPGGVETCDPTGVVPTITIIVGSRHEKTRTFPDRQQVLNTGGIDLRSCTGENEGRDWVRVHGHD